MCAKMLVLLNCPSIFGTWNFFKGLYSDSWCLYFVRKIESRQASIESENMSVNANRRDRKKMEWMSENIRKVEEIESKMKLSDKNELVSSPEKIL